MIKKSEIEFAKRQVDKQERQRKRFVRNTIYVIILVWILLMVWLMASVWAFDLEPVKNPPVKEIKLYGLNNDNWGESENAKSHPNDKIFHEKTQKTLSFLDKSIFFVYYTNLKYMTRGGAVW